MKKYPFENIKLDCDWVKKSVDHRCMSEEVKILQTREKDSNSIIKNLEGSIARLKSDYAQA